MLIIEKSDKAVGVVPVFWRQLDERDWVAMLRFSFAPASRDPQLMAAALRWAEEHAYSCYIGPADAPRYFQMFCPSTAIYKTQLAEDNGYAVVRYFYLMLYSPLGNFPEVKMP